MGGGFTTAAFRAVSSLLRFLSGGSAPALAGALPTQAEDPHCGTMDLGVPLKIRDEPAWELPAPAREVPDLPRDLPDSVREQPGSLSL
jgi:hypothetical protein